MALILTALAFFSDRAFDSIAAQRQSTGIVFLAAILEALVLVLLAIWNMREKRKERESAAARREDESVS
jgi:hypothetical protein